MREDFDRALLKARNVDEEVSRELLATEEFGFLARRVPRSFATVMFEITRTKTEQANAMISENDCPLLLQQIEKPDRARIKAAMSYVFITFKAPVERTIPEEVK